MNLARLTTKGRITIPKRLRESAGLQEGDVVSLDIEERVVTMRKQTHHADRYLGGLSKTVTEWTSPEDEDLWRDL